MPFHDQASGFTQISVLEIRKDLAGFFSAIQDGQRFAVFQRYTHLAFVGPADGPARVAPIAQQRNQSPSPMDMDMLLHVYYAAEYARKPKDNQ